MSTSDDVVLVLVFVLWWITVAVCGVMSHFTTTKIVDEVNSRLADEDKLSPVWWGPDKWNKVMHLYREFYPSGDGIVRLRTLSTVMMLASAVGSLAIGLWPGAVLFGILGTAGVRYFYR